MRKSCFYCCSPATLLCDYAFGWPIAYAVDADGRDYPVRALQPPYTCDMPICRDHAELRGRIHIKARKPLGGFDSKDYCPEHCGLSERVTGPMPESEADSLKRAVVALARRRLMRERGCEPLLSGQGELF